MRCFCEFLAAISGCRSFTGCSVGAVPRQAALALVTKEGRRHSSVDGQISKEADTIPAGLAIGSRWKPLPQAPKRSRTTARAGTHPLQRHRGCCCFVGIMDHTAQPWVAGHLGPLLAGMVAGAAAWHLVQRTRACPPPPTGSQGVMALLQNGCREAAARQSSAPVQLVGAGPGDPMLLTMRAAAAISAAEVLVVDRLVPEAIRRLAPSGAEVVVADKRYGRAKAAQEEIYAAVLSGLDRGKRVVRLKGGDPYVFGRGGEEVLHFAAAGYDSEIIPGISSSLAAPLLGGIPLTMRGVADRFLVTTGHGKRDTRPRLPDYTPTCTFVLLMAVSRLGEVTAELCGERGFPSDLPAAVVERAGLPDQRVVRCTLATLVQQSADAGVCAPATVVLGEVVWALKQRRQDR